MTMKFVLKLFFYSCAVMMISIINTFVEKMLSRFFFLVLENVILFHMQRDKGKKIGTNLYDYVAQRKCKSIYNKRGKMENNIIRIMPGTCGNTKNILLVIKPPSRLFSQRLVNRSGRHDPFDSHVSFGFVCAERL